jgi:hypothetical protein
VKGVVFLVGGRGLDVLRDERHGVFYRVLGLSEPWQVVDMKFDLAGKRVVVMVRAGT